MRVPAGSVAVRSRPGALGNVATEDLLYMLHGLGLARDIDLDAVVAASSIIEPAVGHALPSRYYRAARALRARATTPAEPHGGQ